MVHPLKEGLRLKNLFYEAVILNLVRMVHPLKEGLRLRGS